MELRASVIVCTRNRPADVRTFLASLREQTYIPNELIIIDSSDVPLHTDALFHEACALQRACGTQVIVAHTTPGLTYQRNQGIARATGDILYFFDDDVILDPDYLAQMQMIFRMQPLYGGGMGAISNAQCERTLLDRAVRRLFLLQRYDARGKLTLSGMPTHPYTSSQFGEVDVLGGCGMAYRHSVLQQVFFDERLKRYAYLEDVDVSYRVSRFASLFYNPQARLRHMHSPLERDRVVDNRAMFMRNYSYLFFKNIYPHARWRVIAYWWTVLGLFMQALLIRDRLFFQGYYHGLRGYWATGVPAE